VSRIEEALKRTRQTNGEAPAAAGTAELFAPAWSVRDADSGQPMRETAIEPECRFHERSNGLIGFSSEWRERLAIGPQGDSTLIEQFRRLAATLHHARQASGLSSVMITSASPGDGKTLTAVNLALVLSESYRYNVLLVDADLRRPSIPSVVDLTEGSGLSEALRAATEQKLALVSITPRLTLLPAGQPIANSIEALTSPRMQQILEEAATRFDWIVLDAPPVGSATDARLLSHMVGGTLFVIHARQTQFPDIDRALNALGRDQILGVVLNAVEGLELGAYYGEPRTDQERKGR
jgi:capsular exopolysaccharide synthesis family protein